MAVVTTVTDLESIRSIMDSEANILEGMADLFCNVFVGKGQIRGIVTNLQNPNVDEVERQISILKKILCGYTAKENAIAAVIAAATRKEAADLGISPEVICKCLSCGCKKDC